ncbi:MULTISPECIES: response regulator transcription factor [unclassified Caulobacter]|uniref:response regulator transcription factor n=1 Tax=unclassified Caulobacter TaxID=2648921 RepID=UPI0006FFA068|nr:MULTISPECIES: response regulator transcription factor [unclassified Caulobacter]KQV62442.1 LuxR family transcriptional regulator [Caulobacter sp. Root342]KQV65548.1 LuxR family transcriptional regulator [Caulobacter sp. Root343]
MSIEAGSPAPLKVVLVEDDTAFQEAFRTALAGAADLAMVGLAATVAEARALLAGPPVDVLVVDLGLPDGSGVDVIGEAHARWPGCAIMVATTFADERHVIASIEAGASGYLLKDSPLPTIAEDIRVLHGGGSPISPRIARQVLMRFRPDERTPAEGDVEGDAETAGKSAIPSLSEREKETLQLITRGFSFEEIAELMGVSRNTVLTFVRRIYAKLEVRSKTEAVFEARAYGLL